MKTSPKGIEFIKREEGLRLDVYHDVAGFPTVGYGHLLTDADEDIGPRITQAQADALLRQDLEDHEADVDRLVLVPIEQHQFDAILSFTFNLGAHNLRKSTLLRLVNAADFEGAEEQFGRWVYAGGKKVQGLVNRRAREARLFGAGDYGF